MACSLVGDVNKLHLSAPLPLNLSLPQLKCELGLIDLTKVQISLVDLISFNINSGWQVRQVFKCKPIWKGRGRECLTRNFNASFFKLCTIFIVNRVTKMLYRNILIPFTRGEVLDHNDLTATCRFNSVYQ